jgi:nicotinamidase-related amidase
MNWKTDYRSFYYQGAPQPEDPILNLDDTLLLTIDIQNTYLAAAEDAEMRLRWQPFQQRMRDTVIPTVADLQKNFRSRGMDVIHARIACLLEDGRDRSLSQKKPGWNYLLMPKDSQASLIVPELAPQPGEIEITKTTDSALTGTNLRLILTNMGIKNVVMTGIFTDQCVSSTVRSLADESFNVIVIDDGCAAATNELHRQELEIINMIYCQVMTAGELIGYLPPLAT